MATLAPNPRASLLSGLRTGGVRSVSSPLANGVPHTAAPSGAFNIRPVPQNYAQPMTFQDGQEDEGDQVLDLPTQNPMFNGRQMPLTAAVDGPNNRFMQQQRGMNPNSVPFSPGFGNQQPQQSAQAAQAFQMQMMQLEILRLQAMQAQQYQAEIIAQAQRQQQQQQAQHPRRASAQFVPPATAGPASLSFPSGINNSQLRRGNQAEFLKSQLGLNGSNDADANQVPMTAALGGKFGSRSLSMGTGTIGQFGLPQDDAESTVPVMTMNVTPPTPSSTTVISGGTSLGTVSAPVPVPPSKSESASSWRRGGNNNSVLSGNNRGSISISPSRVTPSPPRSTSSERSSPPPANGATAASKSRPVALKFNAAASQAMMPAVAIDRATDSANTLGSAATDFNINSAIADDGYSTADSTRSRGRSASPTTPHSTTSASSLNVVQDIRPPLSPREEASKKLYEGLGIGKPRRSPTPQQDIAQVQATHAPNGSISLYSATPMTASYRVASQPVRQPIGPPSHVEELGPKNFASRLRRKALGGIGAALTSAKERREILEL